MKKVSGFTLLELMIVLSIVGILLTVGIPAIGDLVKRNRMVSATNELVSALAIIRSEAIKLNQKVTICKSSNGSSCNAALDWEDGWIIFSDSNGDRVINGADRLLRIVDNFNDTKLAIRAKDSANLSINDLTFTSRGLPKKANGELRSGTFSVCIFDNSNNLLDSRAVILSPSGRVRSSESSGVISCPVSP